MYILVLAHESARNVYTVYNDWYATHLSRFLLHYLFSLLTMCDERCVRLPTHAST